MDVLPQAVAASTAWKLDKMEIPVTGLPVIVFDVNETLLDLETLASTFERIFGEASILRLWSVADRMDDRSMTANGPSFRCRSP